MANQQTFWNTQWRKKGKIGKPNPFAKKVLPYFKRKQLKLLDLGCGDGRDTIYFATHGQSVVAVDFSKTGIATLRDELRQRSITHVECKRMDMSKDLRKFNTSTFDIVYAHLSLLYFSDTITTKIFNELYRILRPGGSLFVKVKSTSDTLYGKGKMIEKDLFQHGHVRRFFSKEYLQAKLKRFTCVSLKKTSARYHKYRSSFLEGIARKTK